MPTSARQVYRLVGMVDRLRIQLLDDDSRAVDDGDLLGDWLFSRPAPWWWTVRRWERERIVEPLGLQALVNPEFSYRDEIRPKRLWAARRSNRWLWGQAVDDDLRLAPEPQWVLVQDRAQPLVPPPRPGETGEVVRTPCGLAFWLDMPAEPEIYLSVNTTHSEYGPPLRTEDLRFPSGVVRIGRKDCYTDVVTRYARVSVYVRTSRGLPWLVGVSVDPDFGTPSSSLPPEPIKELLPDGRVRVYFSSSVTFEAEVVDPQSGLRGRLADEVSWRWDAVLRWLSRF